MDNNSRLRLYRAERWLIAAAYSTAILFTLGIIAVQWPNYWVYVASEQTPMTWLQSAVWFGSVVLALLCCLLVYAREGASRLAGLWLMLAAAFAYLMMDERFAFHERVRDKFLKPTGIKLLPWEEAGDFILLIYAAVALLLLIYIIQAFKSRRGALICFAAAAVLFATAVGMDTLDVTKMTKAAERLEQSCEEIVELLGVTTLFCSVLMMLIHYTAELAGPQKDAAQR